MISFDYLMLNTFINQEKEFLTGARITKIQQPTRKELLLYLRSNSVTRTLYININAQFYHFCFISEENKNKRMIEIPQNPPMFCMLLRKYILNSKIAKINQPEGERILELYIETYNELADKIYLCLSIELMGKYSNMILYNTDTGIILGCAHNVGEDKSQVREVYGTIPYKYPPFTPSNSFIEERYAFLCKFFNSTAQKFLNKQNFNEIIDNYYTHIISKYKYTELKKKYYENTNRKLEKITKIFNNLQSQKDKGKSADIYRLYGDLIMANLYNNKDYTDKISVFDYENNKNITINLKKEDTLKENANRFYKKYNKAKNSELKIEELIKKTAEEKQYLEQLLYSITTAENIKELKELQEEIESGKPIEKYNKKQSIEPFKEVIDGNTFIYIGKNNKQNDYIITKIANDEDLWFHTKDNAGSHVLLKSENPTNELILKCAELAKSNSSVAKETKVGIIYTKRKYIKKPPKSPLGYVTYRNEKEIII